MAIFKNTVSEWERTMTETDLDEMEAQGLDVGAYREKLAIRRAKEREQAEKDRKLYYNPTDLSRLDPYAATPRSMGTPFFNAVAGKAPWFGKEKWRRRYTEGKIIYVGVVNAPQEVWKGGMHEDDSHHIIGVYALDETHMRDVAWLQRVTVALKEMCEGRRAVAADCRNIAEQVEDESNWRAEPLGRTISEGAEAYTRRLAVYDKDLPKGYLPTDGIVPHFWYDGTIKCIPAELYKA